MTYLGLSIHNYALATFPSEIKNEMKSENIGTKFYSLVPTNISVIPESLPVGNLYLSSILSNRTATYTRNLTDELFPFQLDRWYQHIQFVRIYLDRNPNENLTINNLVIGQF